MPFADAALAFSQAVGALATSTGRIQERLIDAFTIGLAKVRPNDLPDGFNERFQDLRSRLTGSPPLDVPDIEGTVNSMSEGGAQVVANELMSLAHAVEQEFFRQQFEVR